MSWEWSKASLSTRLTEYGKRKDDYRVGQGFVFGIVRKWCWQTAVQIVEQKPWSQAKNSDFTISSLFISLVCHNWCLQVHNNWLVNVLLIGDWTNRAVPITSNTLRFKGLCEECSRDLILRRVKLHMLRYAFLVAIFSSSVLLVSQGGCLLRVYSCSDVATNRCSGCRCKRASPAADYLIGLSPIRVLVPYSDMPKIDAAIRSSEWHWLKFRHSWGALTPEN